MTVLVDFPGLWQKVKRAKIAAFTLPLATLPIISHIDFDLQDQAARQARMTVELAENKTQILQAVKQDLTITDFIKAAQPVHPVNVDSLANVLGDVMNFSDDYKDSLAHGIRDYQATQGYKYFDAASRYVLTSLNIANQSFLSPTVEEQRLLDSAGVLNPVTRRLIAPVYTKLPSVEEIAQTPQEKLHAIHWKETANFAIAGYVQQLSYAATAGQINNEETWHAWNKHLRADEGYIPGAGGHILELGAFAEQMGLWAEEHQQARGVSWASIGSRHIGTSKHYAYRYHVYHTDLSQALDIFGPGRQYSPEITRKLDYFYQHHVLPHRDMIGISRGLFDHVWSETEDKYVTAGDAIWYVRGHYGDHTHVSGSLQYALLYAGPAAQEEHDKRQAVIDYFNEDKPMPREPIQKANLPAKSNRIVINPQHIVPIDEAYASDRRVQQKRAQYVPKSRIVHRHDVDYADNSRALLILVTSQGNGRTLYQPADAHRFARNAQEVSADSASMVTEQNVFVRFPQPLPSQTATSRSMGYELLAPRVPVTAEYQTSPSYQP